MIELMVDGRAIKVADNYNQDVVATCRDPSIRKSIAHACKNHTLKLAPFVPSQFPSA